MPGPPPLSKPAQREAEALKKASSAEVFEAFDTSQTGRMTELDLLAAALLLDIPSEHRINVQHFAAGFRMRPDNRVAGLGEGLPQLLGGCLRDAGVDLPLPEVICERAASSGLSAF